VFQVLLDADEAVLRSRIEGSDEAMAWRLDHLDEYKAARSWMAELADLVVDTVASTPPQIARRILAGLPDLRAKAGAAKADDAKSDGEKPDGGAGPGAQAKPDAAAKADTPAKAEAAPKPDTPAKPDAAAKPDTPAQPEAAAKPDTPAKPEAAAKPDTPAKPDAAPQRETALADK
jgi:hypothetical protein